MPSSAWDYLRRPDVTVICHFKSRDSGREFIVANAHISFVGYKLRDLQALQTTTVMKCLTDLAKNGDSYLPHIIAGDFNQQPESPGYQILLRGDPSKEALDELKRHRHIADDAKPEVEANSEGLQKKDGDPAKIGLFHLLGADYFRHFSDGLKSAYLEGLKGNEPRVTCIDLEQDNSKQTLDYIWYSDPSLTLESVVDVPSEAQIDAEVAFPSQTFPSDHLSLCATFRFK